MLTRRNFLLTSAFSLAAAPILKSTLASGAEQGATHMAFELPPLPYGFDALEPHIDAQTMQIHHDRHHGTYVTNLNGAIEKHPELGGKTVEELLGGLDSVPEDVRTVVRNNGGGHYNHSLFWQIMGPNGGGEPTGEIASAIDDAFGGFASFKDALTRAAVGQFGSGWGW